MRTVLRRQKRRAVVWIVPCCRLRGPRHTRSSLASSGAKNTDSEVDFLLLFEMIIYLNNIHPKYRLHKITSFSYRWSGRKHGFTEIIGMAWNSQKGYEGIPGWGVSPNWGPPWTPQPLAVSQNFGVRSCLAESLVKVLNLQQNCSKTICGKSNPQENRVWLNIVKSDSNIVVNLCQFNVIQPYSACSIFFGKYYT